MTSELQLERKREYNRRWSQNNPEKVKTSAAASYIKHKESRKNRLKKYREINLGKRLLSSAKYRAKKYRLDFNLELCDIILPVYCPILGILLEKNAGTSKDSSYSLDRVDCNQGYIKGNIQVISHKANTMKSSATIEELLQFSNWIRTKYG